jgi:iron complex outermembrane receptor protein
MGNSAIRRPLRLGALASSISIVLSAGTLASGSASAQEPADAEELVIVTGTRIEAREGYDAPTPTTVVDSEYMESLGITNVADIVVQIPSNVSTFQPATTGGSAFFVGSTLANLRGLNPFFGTRTLTLVDSKRHVPTNQGGSVDLNAIPSVLIDRMEVVTGGASAAYGSEAISGVVNILLDKDLEGIKLDLDYGNYDGEGDNYHVGAAGGMDVFDGRGHIVLGAEITEQDPIRSCANHGDWCSTASALFFNYGGPFDQPGTLYDWENNPFLEPPRFPGEPQYLVVPNVRQNQISYNGVIYNSGLQADAAGTGVLPFEIGEFGTLSPFQTETGGDGRPYYDGQTLMPQTERSTAMASMRYDFSDSMTGYFDVSFASTKADNIQEGAQGFGNDGLFVCVTPDYAFLEYDGMGAPANALTQAIADNFGNGAAAFQCVDPFFFFPTGTLVRKDFTQETQQVVVTDSDSTRIVLGLEGDLGGSSWTWDTYFQYGKTERSQIGYEYRSANRYAMAIDAVLDGSGEPACRVTVTGILPNAFVDPVLAEGCVPINIFGQNLTPEARAYAFGDIIEFNDIEQTVVAANFTGELWQGFGAGPLLAAAGIEFRNEELANRVAGEEDDPVRIDIVAQYGDAFGGDVDVTEAYLELELPVVSGKQGAELLAFNVAYRDASYETTDKVRSGGTSKNDVEAWKFSYVWDPTDWLRFRGSRSQDIRAPGFRELYWSLTQPADPNPFGFGVTVNPWLPDLGFPGSQNDPRTFNLSGNVALRPEKAITDTYGFIVSPGGAGEGFRFSADYYHITITDGILLAAEPTIIGRCYNLGDPASCALIEGEIPAAGPPGGGDGWLDIQFVKVPYENGRRYETDGIDFAADYTKALSEGSIFLQLLTTRTLETIVTSPPVFVGGEDTVRDISGQTGGDTGFFSDWAGSPNWSHNLTFSYARGPFMITAQGRYISDGIIDKQTPKFGPGQPGYNPNFIGSVTNNRTSGHFTLNLSGSYRLDWGNVDALELFMNIDNALNEDPPFSSGAVGGANPIFFPTMGRSYRLGVRVRM